MLMWGRRAGETGYMLLLVPVILVGLALLAIQGVQRSRLAMKVAGAEMDRLQAGLCVRQCAALAVNAADRTLEGNGVPRAGTFSCPCGERDGLDCESRLGSPVQDAAANCYGLEAARTEVAVQTLCRSPGISATADLKETVRFEEIPIFQFAVFFDKVLEIHPGQDMDITGRVHSNDTLRIFPNKGSLRLHDWVTSAGVMEGRRPLAGSSEVAFPAADGSGPGSPLSFSAHDFQALDKAIPSWTSWRKGHRVAFSDRGGACGKVERLDLPVRGLADPHALVEWREGADDQSLRFRKFAWRATLIYKEGWKDGDLRPRSLPEITRAPGPKAPMDGDRVTFWDARDSVLVKLIPVDVEKLQEAGGDSVVYLHDAWRDAAQGGKDVGGFLLHRGAALRRSLTIASNTRLYVWGDYNAAPAYDRGGGSMGPYPAALIGDAFTQLSNAWDGRDFPKGADYGKPVADKGAGRTALNACLMAGMAERGGSWTGQGGYHNFIHFLENWKGAEHAFSGSAVCLWSARISTGSASTAHYYPPVRKWAFDPMYRGLRHMPPATPRGPAPRLAAWETARGGW